MMVGSRIGFDMVEEKKNINTPSPKKVLRGMGMLQSVIKMRLQH